MIIDTSAVLAVLLNEETKPAILRAIGTSRQRAAASLPFEIGIGLSASMKKKRFDVAVASAAMREFEGILDEIELISVPMTAAIELAGRLNIYAYDAFVLAVAAQEGETLLSLDAAMVRHARSIGIETVELR